jgi:hypothetical protein
MQNKFIAAPLLAFALLGGALSTGAFANPNGSSGNTVNNTNVTNTLGTGKPVTVNRSSRSTINNPTGPNVHNDINITLSDGCGQSRVNNDVSHRGSTGAVTNVNVDVCNPAAGGSRRRR